MITRYSIRLCNNKNEHRYNLCIDCQKNALVIAFLLNFFMFLLEFIYGVLNNSATLLGESAHDIGDAFVLGTSIFVISSTNKVKSILAIVKVILMGSFALLTLYHSYNNFILELVPEYKPIIYVGFIALIGNILSAFFLFAYREVDINLKSSFICVRNDTLASLLTIITGIIVMYYNTYIADVIAGIFIGIFVLYSSLSLGREIFKVMSD